MLKKLGDELPRFNYWHHSLATFGILGKLICLLKASVFICIMGVLMVQILQCSFLLHFFPLLFILLISPFRHNHHTVVYVYQSLSFLLDTATTYPPSPKLSVCYESVSVLLVSSVCSLDSYMSEIIWYLSFFDWLISFSIMFSSFIHTVTKDNIFFFFMA